MLEIADPVRLLRSRFTAAPALAVDRVDAVRPVAPWIGLGEVVLAPPGEPARVRLWDAIGQVVTPAWALPFAYLPRPGDLLVVIARGERSYVLSVARGRGTSLLWTRGDLRVSAGGALRLAGDLGVRVVGDAVTLRARALEVTAEALHVVADEAIERVASLSRLVAGAVQRVTAGTESVVARRVTLLGQDLVKLDAEVTVIG